MERLKMKVEEFKLSIIKQFKTENHPIHTFLLHPDYLFEFRPQMSIGCSDFKLMMDISWRKETNHFDIGFREVNEPIDDLNDLSSLNNRFKERTFYDEWLEINGSVVKLAIIPYKLKHDNYSYYSQFNIDYRSVILSYDTSIDKLGFVGCKNWQQFYQHYSKIVCGNEYLYRKHRVYASDVERLEILRKSTVGHSSVLDSIIKSFIAAESEVSSNKSLISILEPIFSKIKI